MNQPAHDTKHARKVVLYTRLGCHLCEQAQHLLVEHQLVPELVDVDTDPALQNRFGTCVPVVEIDGRIRFRGRIDPVLLQRIIGRRA